MSSSRESMTRTPHMCGICGELMIAVVEVDPSIQYRHVTGETEPNCPNLGMRMPPAKNYLVGLDTVSMAWLPGEGRAYLGSEHDSRESVVNTIGELMEMIREAVEHKVCEIRIKYEDSPRCMHCGHALHPSHDFRLPLVHLTGATEDECEDWGRNTPHERIDNLERELTGVLEQRRGMDADMRGMQRMLSEAREEIRSLRTESSAKSAVIGERNEEITKLLALLEDAQDVIKEHKHEATRVTAMLNGTQVDLEATKARADKYYEYGYDLGYWYAMMDVLRHVNAWQAFHLGQPIKDDDGRYEKFDSCEEMLQRQIYVYLDDAPAGWGEKFPTYEEWSK